MGLFHPKYGSMVRKFTTEYLMVSLIPLLIFFFCTVAGAFFAQHYVAGLIQQSTHELSQDSRNQLEALGRSVIQGKARDVAKQIEIFLSFHPEADIKDLQQSDYFKSLSMQSVGETGYTCLYESGTGIMRIHPNPGLVDRDMAFLAERLPSWWAIFKPSLAGVEVSGYYDWIEPDGSIRPKYMTMTPIQTRFHSQVLMVAATTYIDEFSAPILSMKKKADDITASYKRFVAEQVWMIGAVIAALLLSTFGCVLLLGRRSALRFMLPIVHLANATQKFGEGQWQSDEDVEMAEREDEIGDLSRSFAQMRIQVKALFQDLETRLAELKTIQEALKESEAHYRSLFDGVPVGLYRTTPSGRILNANPNLIKMLGFSNKEEFLSRRAEELWADPEERAQWQKTMVDSEGGKNCEIRMRRCDGSFLWVDNHSIAVRDDNGEVLYYEGSLKDITSRKETEEALRQNEERYKKLYDESKRAEELYRSLLHSSADAIVIYDREGKARYLSPAFTAMFGWSLEEVEGKSIPFVPESEREASLRIIRELMEKGTPCQGYETVRFSRDGKMVDVSLSASRYEDHQGRPAGIMVILRDISERKKLQEQLQLVQRMESIGTLAGGIAHDFNNLMMGIQGNVSVMLYDMSPDQENFKRLKNIEQLIASGSKLSRQLLGYARKGRYEIKAVDLNGLVSESAETFARARKEISVHLQLHSDQVVADVDRSQIEQVLFNLFVNAADAMPHGGDLYLKTGLVSHKEFSNKPYTPLPGTYCLIEVTDTGTGMDAGTQKRIFDPFFTTKAIGRGTGLGLSSAYGIIKAHSGYIDVESEIGKGSVFRIYLSASRQSPAKSLHSVSKIQKGKGRILLVDDEALVLDAGMQMLEKMGYEVVPAANGWEAAMVYANSSLPIDLIVLDLIMPGKSGSDTFDELKRINPDAKVLLSSGYSIDGQVLDILNRGCDGFIQKPYNMEILSRKISEILKPERGG